MNATLLDLKRLQEVDDRLKAGRQAVAASSAQMREAAARLKGFEDKLTCLNSGLTEMRARYQELETESTRLAQKRDNNGKRQLTVKNNNEFTALTKEAEYIAARANEVDDETLELMDRLEKAEFEKTELAAVLLEENDVYGRTTAELEAALKAGDETLASLTAERGALMEALPPDRLRQYNDIAKNRAGRAVAPAAAGLCQACGLGFPPQLFNELQRNEKIQTCPNCGRILYWRDHPDFQAEA